MPKATTSAAAVDARLGPAADHVERFAEALQVVARSITQARLHERLLRTGRCPARSLRRGPAPQAGGGG